MLRLMPLLIIFFVTLIVFGFSLTGCAPYRPDTTKAGACNELNSRIIFSGGTSNIQRAEIQDAQTELEQKTYDKNCER